MSDETRFFSEDMTPRELWCLTVRCAAFCAIAYVVVWSPALVAAVLP